MAPSSSWSNWSGAQTCTPRALERPSNTEEVVAAVQRAAEHRWKLRVTGAGHSFSPLVPTDGMLLSLDQMSRVLHVDKESRKVKVQAGISLHALNQALAQEGLALVNLGDVDVQSAAGAISTGTHGTGVRLKNLSAQVEEVELVDGQGRVRAFSAQDVDLNPYQAARVSLGALGVITSLTFRCVPSFNLRALEAPTPLPELLEKLDESVAKNDHFEFFAFPHAQLALARVNNLTADPPTPSSRLGAWFTDIFLENHLLGLVCKLGRAMPGNIPAFNRLVMRLASRSEWVDRSDRVFASPRLIRFNEMEYAFRREAAQEVIRELLTIAERHPVNFPIEVRFVAEDDALLSPAYGRESCYVAVHMFQGMEHEPFFRDVESAANAFGGRPHWGKMHFQTATTLAPRYPAWSTFQGVRAQLDPAGLFTTEPLERILGPAAK